MGGVLGRTGQAWSPAACDRSGCHQRPQLLEKLSPCERDSRSWGGSVPGPAQRGREPRAGGKDPVPCPGLRALTGAFPPSTESAGRSGSPVMARGPCAPPPPPSRVGVRARPLALRRAAASGSWVSELCPRAPDAGLALHRDAGTHGRSQRVFLSLFPQNLLRLPRLAGLEDLQLHRPRRGQQRLPVQRVQVQEEGEGQSRVPCPFPLMAPACPPRPVFLVTGTICGWGTGTVHVLGHRPASLWLPWYFVLSTYGQADRLPLGQCSGGADQG